MPSPLDYSVFKEVLFPTKIDKGQSNSSDLHLRRSLSHVVSPEENVRDLTWSVFDFETTGLSADNDRIIEIGAIKIKNGEILGEMSTLINVDIPLSDVVQNITGITPDMLVGKPNIQNILPEFLDFVSGTILVAHNAEFDMSMLKAEADRQGFDLNLPCFCTLKLARELLPDLPRKNLDTLAEYYELTFEARHRSIGDAKVTVSVLHRMLEEEGTQLLHWADFEPFKVV